MSTRLDLLLDRAPFIRLVERAHRALDADMTRAAVDAGFTEIRGSHNAVLSTLSAEGDRISELALRAGITKQSMGEVVRDLVELGIVELGPDPSDGRAKLVTYTERGLGIALGGRVRLRELDDVFAAALGADAYETTRAALTRVVALVSPEADA